MYKVNFLEGKCNFNFFDFATFNPFFSIRGEEGNEERIISTKIMNFSWKISTFELAFPFRSICIYQNLKEKNYTCTS